jgi:hypothetical protein
LSNPLKEEEHVKAMTPITMPMKQASRERIMSAWVASQYAGDREDTERARLILSTVQVLTQ